MPKEISKIIVAEKAYYTVPDAARYLGTTTTKIRELMGQNQLEWTQVRTNGKLLISAESLVRHKYKKAP